MILYVCQAPGGGPIDNLTLTMDGHLTVNFKEKLNEDYLLGGKTIT